MITISALMPSNTAYTHHEQYCTSRNPSTGILLRMSLNGVDHLSPPLLQDGV
jgi:hypothetical protein